MGDMSYSKFGFGGVFLDAMRQASLLSQNPQRPDFIRGLERWTCRTAICCLCCKKPVSFFIFIVSFSTHPLRPTFYRFFRCAAYGVGFADFTSARSTSALSSRLAALGSSGSGRQWLRNLAKALVRRAQMAQQRLLRVC